MTAAFRRDEPADIFVMKGPGAKLIVRVKPDFSVETGDDVPQAAREFWEVVALAGWRITLTAKAEERDRIIKVLEAEDIEHDPDDIYTGRRQRVEMVRGQE